MTQSATLDVAGPRSYGGMDCMLLKGHMPLKQRQVSQAKALQPGHESPTKYSRRRSRVSWLLQPMFFLCREVSSVKAPILVLWAMVDAAFCLHPVRAGSTALKQNQGTPELDTGVGLKWD